METQTAAQHVPKMLTQVKAMEEALAAVAEGLGQEVVEGRSADELVRVKLTGDSNAKRVRIKPAAYEGIDDLEKFGKYLEKSLEQALQDALDQVAKLAAERTAKATGNFTR